MKCSIGFTLSGNEKSCVSNPSNICTDGSACEIRPLTEEEIARGDANDKPKCLDGSTCITSCPTGSIKTSDQDSNMICVESSSTKLINIDDKEELLFSTSDDKKIILVNFYKLLLKVSTFGIGNYYLYKEIKLDETSKPLSINPPAEFKYIIKSDPEITLTRENSKYTNNVFSIDTIIEYDGDKYALNTQNKIITPIKATYVYIGIVVFLIMIMILIKRNR